MFCPPRPEFRRWQADGKTVTLTEPGVAGEWDVESLDDGRLLLSPHIGPSIVELEAEYGERLQHEAFERRWDHLPRDGNG